MKKVALFSLQNSIKKSITEFFDKKEIERLGRISGFIKRRSKLTAYRFLLTLMFSRFAGDKLSLNDLCNELDDKFGCHIAKQSLDERFNPETVQFLKMAVSQSFSKKLVSNSNLPFLSHFSAIKIQDSTSFQLPKNLSGSYAGTGGSSTGALARIQFEYDLKSMEMTTLDLTSGAYQDVTYSKDYAGSIEKGELLVRDLGYISRDFMRTVIKQEAFFINRLRDKQNVYIKQDSGDLVKLDFTQLLRRMKQRKVQSEELDIFIEIEGEFLEMRLIAEKLPDEVYAKRIRKAEKGIKKKGYNLTDSYKARARFNLFVTNVDKGVLNTRNVGYLYSLRWQVELVFKSWKSTFNIAKVKAFKKERFECQILARLLLIIISWKMFSTLNKASVSATNRKSPLIMSYYKFNKLIYARLESFMLAIIYRGIWFNRFISSLIRKAVGKNQNIEAKNRTFASIHICEILQHCSELQRFNIKNAA
ncbi:IS4 family transposase [Bacteroidota bacterium]